MCRTVIVVLMAVLYTVCVVTFGVRSACSHGQVYESINESINGGLDVCGVSELRRRRPRRRLVLTARRLRQGIWFSRLARSRWTQPPGSLSKVMYKRRRGGRWRM